jgi:hypothetical protein
MGERDNFSLQGILPCEAFYYYFRLLIQTWFEGDSVQGMAEIPGFEGIFFPSLKKEPVVTGKPGETSRPAETSKSPISEVPFPGFDPCFFFYVMSYDLTRWTGLERFRKARDAYRPPLEQVTDARLFHFFCAYIRDLRFEVPPKSGDPHHPFRVFRERIHASVSSIMSCYADTAKTVRELDFPDDFPIDDKDNRPVDQIDQEQNEDRTIVRKVEPDMIFVLLLLRNSLRSGDASHDP